MIIKEKRNNNLIGKTLTISIRKGIDVTDKSQQWIWFINKENPKRIHKTFLGTFLKDINKGLTSVNASARFSRYGTHLTQMNFRKPYIFFCTYLDARKWKNKNE